MTADWEAGAGLLERRYQRLLAWYPPRHRPAGLGLSEAARLR